jgi:hypothetical protein
MSRFYRVEPKNIETSTGDEASHDNGRGSRSIVRCVKTFVVQLLRFRGFSMRADWETYPDTQGGFGVPA